MSQDIEGVVRRLGEPLPAGGGSMSSVDLILPEGSIVNARPPASVAAGRSMAARRARAVSGAVSRQVRSMAR